MIELVAKYLSGNASLEEKRQVEEWRNENSEEFLALSEAWAAAGSQSFDRDKARMQVMGRIRTQEKFNTTSNSDEKGTGRRGMLRLWGIAASLAALVAVGYFLFRGGNESVDGVLSVDGWVVAETSAGETKDVELPDGSVVSMSELSRLSYPETFGDERKVTFSGRAFFDITPDELHPFKVETVEALVTVLGTSFQVKAEASAGYSEVIVETGLVSLAKKPQANVAERSVKVELTPGEIGVVKREGGGVAKSKNMNQNYLAWKTNRMVFSKSTLKDVASTLTDVYKIDVTFNGEIANCRLTATFDKKPIEEVMEVIGQTFGFEVTEAKNGYEIKGKSCR